MVTTPHLLLVMRIRAFAFAISLLGLLLPNTAAAATTFVDVPSYNEFADDIQALANAGIVSGTSPGYFSPYQHATRGELAKIVMRASSRNVPVSNSSRFSDVPVGAPFHDFIEAAAAQGVISGYGDGTFRPDAWVSRAEAAKMVVRAFSLPLTTTGGPHFFDVPTGHPLYTDVEAARSAGIVSGYPDGGFHPNEPIIRAHLAKVVNRARTKGAGTLNFKMDTSAASIANDGISNATITISATKSDGKADIAYNADVTFTTTAGTFSENGKTSLTTSFKSGRAQVTLVSSRNKETATVVAQVNGARAGSVTVEFTDSAPRVGNGRGETSKAGVGTQRVVLYDNDVLSSTKATPFPQNFAPVAGGATLIEVYESDSNGDPLVGDTLRATILTGDGRVDNGTFPTTGPSSAISQRSVNLTDEGNGRYLGWYQAVTSQIPGTVTIEIINLSTSPSLVTTASLSVKNPTLFAELTQNHLLTRKIGAATADIRNRAEILIETLDEHGDPVSISDNAQGTVTLNARVIDGATGDAFLGSSPANSTTVSATPVQDITGRQIPGLYALAYTAGSAPGNTTIEVRAQNVIGQPRTTVKLTTEDPRIVSQVSSTTVGAGQSSTLLVKVVDANGVPIVAENLQANLQSGVGSLSSVASGTANAVILDPVPTAAGFYSATFTAPASVATSQATQIRITDLSRTTLIQQVATIQVVPANSTSTTATSMMLEPLRTNIGALDSVPVMIILRDSSGTGVSGQTANLSGRLVVGSGAFSAIAEIGNGLYVATYSANRSVGNIRAQVQYNAPGVPSLVQEVSFNVSDNKITTETVDDNMLIDEGTGVLTYVRDEDNVPIPGLQNPGFTPPTVGNVVFSNITEIDPNVLGVGSGVYIIGVDSTALTPPGTITIRVTETGAATAPYDSTAMQFRDVNLSLEAQPTDDVLTGRCVLIIARVTDENGDAVNGALVDLEITKGSGQMQRGNVGCSGTGTTKVTVGDSEGSSATDNKAGVYVGTFKANPVKEDIEITARVSNSATQVEAHIPVRVR